MYNQGYEEYMRNVLGYTYSPTMCNPNVGGQMVEPIQEMNINLEELYPEIYKIVYPMVQKVCMQNTRPITKELIDEMVNEIYTTVEPNEPINININLTNNVRSNSINKPTNTLENGKPVQENRENKSAENRQGNFLLNDLIRILLIRELLGRPGHRPPQRPPMRPPFPGGRPPFRPRDFEMNYDIYEY